MSGIEKRVREFCDRFVKDEDWLEYNAMTLTMSFLLGLPANECVGMCPEAEWDDEMLEQYDEIEGIINRIRKEKDKV